MAINHKVAGFRNKKKKMCAYVYEAVNPQGVGVFFGVNSSLTRTTIGCLLEAVVEASLIATNHDFQRILFLSDSRELVKAFNSRKAPDWQDTIRVADLTFLVQNGLLCKMILYPPSLVC